MHKSLQLVCDSLDQLAQKIIDGYGSDKPLSEIWGWNLPSVNRHDLASMAINISDKLKSLDINELDGDLESKIDQIPLRIDSFNDYTFSYLYNGNGSASSFAFFGLIDWINSTLEPLFSWDSVDSKSLPPNLKRKLRSIQLDLDSITIDKADLENKINLINEATEAAESLPTDLESLKEAKRAVDQISTSSSELLGKIDSHNKDAEKIAIQLKENAEQATKIVEQCSEAYRIATSTGLAGAFNDRANSLSISMWVWVGLLLGSLAIGGWIGSHRVELLAKLIESPNPSWGGIWIHFVLSIISIGAPIWFAWIATKQINQRFRLSEDYAFKSSVSKAYEGYRREAVKIDPEFESRLFGSALTRLEEAPLRLVEADPHGSPWHEFLSSPAFTKALDKFPELKTDFLGLIKNKMDASKLKPELIQDEEDLK